MAAKQHAIATLNKRGLLEVGRAFELEVKTQMRPYRNQATEVRRPETCDRLQPVPAECWSRSDSAP
jgi:hypothetical protein